MRKPRTFSSAVATSLAVHAIGLAAMAAWSNQALRTKSRFAGDPQAMTLTFADPQLSPEPVSVQLAVEPRVVVEPNKARIAKRRYIAAPSQLSSPLDSLEIPASKLTSALPQRAPDVDTLQSPWEDAQPRESLSQRKPMRPGLTSSQVVVPSSVGSDTSIRPDLSHNPPPTYPVLALQRGWEGTVLLRLSIDAEGRITSLEVMRSSGHPILDGAAANAVRHWTATPALRQGKPVATVEVLPVQFKLR